MNKQLQLYGRDQQIKYLELEAKIQFVLLKLYSLQEAETTEYQLDNLDLIVQLSSSENTSWELVTQ